MIEIDHQQRQAGALAIGSRPFLQQPLVEAAAVGEAGETVFGGQRLEPSFQILLLRHIARDRDDAVDLAVDRPRDAQGRIRPRSRIFRDGACGR